MNYKYTYVSSALSIEKGEKALVCFPNERRESIEEKGCEIFDIHGATITSFAQYTHHQGKLGVYKGKPTTVGSEIEDGKRKVETWSSTGGWESLPDYPR